MWQSPVLIGCGVSNIPRRLWRRDIRMLPGLQDNEVESSDHPLYLRREGARGMPGIGLNMTYVPGPSLYP